MCGITALLSFDNQDIFHELYESLYHLQHRGQDSFGFSFLKDDKIELIKEKCMLSNSSKTTIIQTSCGIGHVRYPTMGENTINEVQPFVLNNISIVHNGQIWKTDKLINYMKDNNIVLNQDITSDSIILLHLLSHQINKYQKLNNEIIMNIISEIRDIVEGSYNCMCIIEGFGLVCFKDKNSIRPLVLGKKNNNYIISSESVCIDSIDYDFVSDIYNNDLHIFNLNEKYYEKVSFPENNPFTPCIFEWIYLAREESTMYGVNVYDFRYQLGKHLGYKILNTLDYEDLKKIDYIVPVPDTSKPVALSLSRTLDIPYCEAITKNRYVSRTFIMGTQENRKKNIKRKLNVIKSFIQNKNLLIVDDSIVRGNTIKHIVNLLKNNGANDIYIASSCPEIINGNNYGIDIPRKEDLLCFNKTNKQIIKDLNIKDIFFQEKNKLLETIQSMNPSIKYLEMSVFKK